MTSPRAIKKMAAGTMGGLARVATPVGYQIEPVPLSPIPDAPPAPVVTQIASDFSFAEGIRGIAFDGTYWYHAASFFDHIVRETYPTRGSATTIHTTTGGATIEGLTTDGTNLYWIEQDVNETIMSMPVAGGTVTTLLTKTSGHLHSLVWHPTSSLLYFIYRTNSGGGVGQDTLHSMTTAGGSDTTLYTSSNSHDGDDDTHISEGLFPMSPSPGYLWGGQTPNGSTGTPGAFVYPLGGTLTIGLRASQVAARGPCGLKSDTALHRFSTDSGHLHEVNPSLSDLGVWSLEDAGMVSDLTSRWSTHSADFSKTHFGAGGYIWEIVA